MRRLKVLWFFAMLLAVSLANRASAQQAYAGIAPPSVSATDNAHVDLIGGSASGEFDWSIGIGNESSGLFPHQDFVTGNNSFTGTVYETTDYNGLNYYATVYYGGKTDLFTRAANSSTYQPLYGTNSTFSCNGYTCVLSRPDGTIIEFDKRLLGVRFNIPQVAGEISVGYSNVTAEVTKVTKPDGEILNFVYSLSGGSPSRIFSSLGWSIGSVPVNDSVVYCPSTGACSSSAIVWPTFTSAPEPGVAATRYTDPVGNSMVFYDVTHTGSGTCTDPYKPELKIVLPNGMTKIIQYNAYTATQQTAPNCVGNPDPNTARVISVKLDDKTWTYNRVAMCQYVPQIGSCVLTGQAIVTSSGPTGTRTAAYSTGNFYGSTLPTSMQPASINSYFDGADTYNYVMSNGLINKITNPDTQPNQTGGYTAYDWDSLQNPITKTVVPKDAGSDTSQNLLTHATYTPCTVTNFKWCNRPVTVTDPNGVTTTYTYSDDHGGVLSETESAVNGIQAQTRYTYTQITPWSMNASLTLAPTMIKLSDGNGGWVDGTTPAKVWRLTGISSCMTMTLATCVNTNDELRTVISYGSDPSNPTYKNVLVASKTISLGDGSLSQTTTFTYDVFGNVTVVDGPRPGVSDAVYYFYDARQRVIGTIGADPDDAGPLLRQATRTTYNSMGMVASVERGTVTGTTADSLNSLTPLEKTVTDFSTAGNALGQAVAVRYYTYESGVYVLKRLSQTNYNSFFKPDCVVTRMNPAVFDSVASTDACTLGPQGTDGPDRIVKLTYDTAGQRVIKTTSAYGTPVQRDDRTVTYIWNGEATSLTDANGNKTVYQLDAFDRRIKTIYPSAADGTTSNANDYEQISFDKARISQSRLRDGLCINFGYDAIGRLSSKTNAAVGGICTTTQTVNESFGYDNFNNVLTHGNNGVSTVSVYNPMGWKQSETTPLGGISFQYDAYGRRTRLTYPDGFYVTYDYLVGSYPGDYLQRILENGSTTLASFANDSYSRRVSVTRGNGVATVFGYDSQSRLTSLCTDITVQSTVCSNPNTPTTGDDIRTSFAYTQANQIRTRNIDSQQTLYNYSSPTAGTTGYTINGLNQVAAAGGTAIAYDLRGNMSNDGSVAYSYNANNLLVSTSSGVSLSYDAENRLMNLVKSGAGSSNTKFLYDGTDLIAEYDGNNSNAMISRYVHGPVTDDPIVWYAGSGTTDKRYITFDQQGSVIGYTDSNGVTKLAAGTPMINAYDEYGVPKSGNIGRFQYTGQTWLPELNVYYYKARLYAPTLGRFLQTDPIGSKDDLDLYAYTGDDPINRADPSGQYGELWDYTKGYAKGLLSGGAHIVADLGSAATSGQPITGQLTKLIANAEVGLLDSKLAPSSAAEGAGFSSGQFDAGLYAMLADAPGGKTAATVEAGASTTTTVGRWMSKGEFNTMSSTGQVVEGAGGRTYVVNTANPADYAAAKPGSVFAKFDVPTDSLKPAGKPEWSTIPGPNVTTKMYGPAPSAMPSATCISIVCTK